MSGNARSPKRGKRLTAEFRREATSDLMWSIFMDMPPHTKATLAAFGIKTQEHIEAIYEPVKYGEITRQQLHEAVGNGENITALVNAASRNPHPGIVFVPDCEAAKADCAKEPTKKQDIDIDLDR